MDENGNVVVTSILWHRSDIEEKSIMEIFYQVFQDNSLMPEDHVCSSVSVIPPEAVWDLLGSSGFRIEQEFGKSRLSGHVPEDQWMVVVAERRV
ncbi:MAG: hypothetical protein ACE5JA_07860 [bacterium]